MDPKTKKSTISRNMVLDAVSSLFGTPKIVALDDDQANLELLFPPANAKTPCDEEATNKPPVQNVTSRENGHHQTMRRSTREKTHPDYLNDYEVEINNCSETSCFFTRALTA